MKKEVALLSLIEWLHGPATHMKPSRQYGSLQAVPEMHERAMKAVGVFHRIGLFGVAAPSTAGAEANNLYMNKPVSNWIKHQLDRVSQQVYSLLRCCII